MPKESFEFKKPLSKLVVIGEVLIFLLLFLAVTTGFIKINHVLHPASLLGLIAAFAGLLVAMLGVGIGVFVAFDWGIFDKKVKEYLAEPLKESKEELEEDFARRMKAVAGLAIAWSKEGLDREADIERVLELDPKLPDIEPLMAEIYLNERLNPVWVGAFNVWGAPLEKTEFDKTALLNYASKWADRAMQNRSIHSPGFPEWVSAIVVAYRKDSESCINLLKVAKQYGFLVKKGLIPFNHSRIDISHHIFKVITSASCGEVQKLDIEGLCNLLELKPVTENDVRDSLGRHFLDLNYFTLWVIDKKDGNSYNLTIQVNSGYDIKKDNPWDDRCKYSMLGYENDYFINTLDEVVKRIFEIMIPIKIMDNL